MGTGSSELLRLQSEGKEVPSLWGRVVLAHRPHRSLISSSVEGVPGCGPFAFRPYGDG